MIKTLLAIGSAAVIVGIVERLQRRERQSFELLLGRMNFDEAQSSLKNPLPKIETVQSMIGVLRRKDVNEVDSTVALLRGRGYAATADCLKSLSL